MPGTQRGAWYKFFLFQLKGAGIELIIESVLPDEILVVAPLYNAAVIQHHNGIRVAHSG